MEQTKSHNGGCLCGAVRYRTHGQPAIAALGQCHHRQARTGSAFGLAICFKTKQVEQLSGRMKSYAFQTEAERSFATRFCPTCGTSLFLPPAAGADLTGVAGGRFDPPPFWNEIKRGSPIRFAR